MNTKNISLKTIISLLVPLIFLTACAAGQKEAVKPEEPAQMSTLPVEEQVKQSQAAFSKILDITMNEDRKSALPKIEDSYSAIIRDYPDTPMAQEAYLRLITISMEDYNPPKIERAESLYNDFISKYPRSPIRGAVEDGLMRFYYAKKNFDRLLIIIKPYIKEYISTGNIRSAFILFLYSEAKFHTGDLTEAKKGYRIIEQRFPNTSEARASANKLREMETIK